MKWLAFSFCLAAIATCEAKEPKASSSPVRDGSTPDKAVIITAPLKEYVGKEWDWIAKHYPGSSMLPYEQALLFHGKGYVDSITFTTARGTRQTVYFDISGVKTK
jgi:hypothetical protein